MSVVKALEHASMRCGRNLKLHVCDLFVMRRDSN